MSEIAQPQVALVAPEAREGTKTALLRVARYETVAVLGVGFSAAVCTLAYAFDRVLTTPSRISSVLNTEVGSLGLVNDNLRFDAARALLFFVPLVIVCITLGAGTFLVAVESRKRVTPWAFVDRVLVQSASASLVVAGVVIGTVGLAVPVATPHLLVRGAIVALGTTVIAAGLTTALRAPGRDPRLIVGGLAALVALSATVGLTDTTGISAGQVPIARSTWSGTGFWTAAPSGKLGALTSYQAVACPTAQFCAALGTGPFGTLWSLSSDGGAKWEPATPTTQNLSSLPGGPGAMGVVFLADAAPYGLSCWARSYCLASGYSPEQSTDGGKHWAPLLSKPGATIPSSTGGADCFAPGSCLLFGYGGGKGAATPILVTHDSGRRWVKAQLPPGAWTLESATCTGPKFCIAVGSATPVETAVVLVSSDGGLSWQVRPAPPDVLSVDEVACPVPERCVVLASPSDGDQVIGGGWSPGLVVYWTGDGGRSWARSTLSARLDTAQVSDAQVACSASTCTAVLSSTNNLPLPTPSVAQSFLLSRDYGRTWYLDRSPGSLGSVAANAEIQALTCNGADVCVAVGDGLHGGMIFYSHDGGRTWAAGHDLRGGPPWG